MLRPSSRKKGEDGFSKDRPPLRGLGTVDFINSVMRDPSRGPKEVGCDLLDYVSYACRHFDLCMRQPVALDEPHQDTDSYRPHKDPVQGDSEERRYENASPSMLMSTTQRDNLQD